MKCECLFCDNHAVARFRAPFLKRAFLICEDDLTRELARLEGKRFTPGSVVVEPLGR